MINTRYKVQRCVKGDKSARRLVAQFEDKEEAVAYACNRSAEKDGYDGVFLAVEDGLLRSRFIAFCCGAEMHRKKSTGVYVENYPTE